MTGEAERHFDLGDELSGQGARALAAGDTVEGHDLFRQAIAAYESALAAAPEHDRVLRGNLRLCIGARRFALGELGVALAHYDRVIERLSAHPDLAGEGEGAEVLAQARLNRAELRLTRGEAEAARREARAVAEQFPDHPYARILLDRCALALGD